MCKPIVIRGSDRAIQALAGGSVYASVLAPDAPMVAADRGLDAVIVAGNRAWDYDARVNQEGMKTVIQMAGEQNQTKGPLPSPGKYIDESYLNEALRELKEGK